MTGAMYSAVAGLKTHMQALNVIGNNVANVNTDGFKSGRYVFQSALYSAVRGGSDGSDTAGGMNPSQLGYGASVSTIDINMSTSNYKPTGKASDCMIDGDGFFLVGNKGMTFATAQDFKSLTLTRVGDIDFMSDGYLAKPDGKVVYGFKCVGLADDGKTPVVSNQLQPICRPRVTADGIVVYDEDTYTLMQEQSEDGDSWPAYEDLPMVEVDSITIDQGTGRISATTKDTLQNIVIGYIAIGNVNNPNGVTQLTGTYYRCGDGAGDLSISMLGGAGSMVYDRSNFGEETYAPIYNTTDEDDEDRYIVGYQWVTGESEDTDERVEKGLYYVNGGRLPGEDDDEDTVAPAEGMRIHTGGTTVLMTSGLEQTDVDLATEISNMILVQRGYQANTRIVTVTDSMLEELVNMKR